MKFKFYQHLLGKSLLITVLAGFAFCGSLKAQTPTTPAKCGNDPNIMATQYPDFWKVLHEFEANWEHYKNHVDLSKFQQTASGKYIIPVVVHVLHEGGSENINRSQILTQFTATNKDFRMANSALSGLSGFAAFDTVVPYFNGADTTYVIHGADTSAMLNRFEFRLATKDPFGVCTDGITRTYTEKSELAGDYSKFKQIISWDRAKYFNIWVVNDILGNTPNQTTLGYAQFPFAFGGQFPLTSSDGICIMHSVFGTSGTATGGTGATVTHESGHWLGLFHIWGDANCGSDGIDDTPVHYGPDFCDGGSPALNTQKIHCPPYLPYTAECYSDTNGTDTVLNALNLVRRNDVGRMWMDFMDYTDDQYLWMFSEQQYRKMNVTMETIAFRGTLSTQANILATGTDDASQATPCHAAPLADLWSTNGSSNYIVMKLICAGASLTMKDGTYNLSGTGSDPNTRVWDLPGGTPATSTTTNPLVQYNTPGIYDVTITSTNADGVSTKTRNNYVQVSSTVADESNFVYYDDFEYSTSLYEQGKWINIAQGWDPAARWEQATNAGYMSAKCMVMKTANSIQYEKDFLISASYDLTTITNEKLYFRYAGARRTTNPDYSIDDQLRVYVSTNCGGTWLLKNIAKINGVTFNKSYLTGDTLYPAGLYTNGFVPTTAGQWNLAEVDLASVSGNANVRVMFEWTSGSAYVGNGFSIYGNDFYIDQVNISNSTDIGLETNTDQIDYSVYPNPVTATSQIYFKILTDSKVTVDVEDITGRVVKQIFSGNMEAGEQYLVLNNADFNSAGIYLVRLTVNGVSSTKKVIIE